MGTRELLENALNLKAEERFKLVESLLRSLDEPDKEIDEIWAGEAERRLEAYRSGQAESVSFEEAFDDLE